MSPNLACLLLSLAPCEGSIVHHLRLRIFHCYTSTTHECCWKRKFKIRSEITTLNDKRLTGRNRVIYLEFKDFKIFEAKQNSVKL